MLKVGTRIRLDAMPEDPNPIPPGTLGTVESYTNLHEWIQIQVKWDNGRHLNLVVPPDRYTVLFEDK